VAHRLDGTVGVEQIDVVAVVPAEVLPQQVEPQAAGEAAGAVPQLAGIDRPSRRSSRTGAVSSDANGYRGRRRW
jgi:hypothetical protein